MLKNIFDSHAHYTDKSFDEDRYELLNTIQEKGVSHIMLSVSTIEDARDALKLSKNYPFVYSAAGIHPECISSSGNNYLNEIEQLVISNRDKIKAIGEIGVDYHYENFDKKRMLLMFEEQLMLAEKLNLPSIIHSRDASKDTLDIIRKVRPSKAVIHCFSGSAETAREVLSLGLHISFTGVLTFNNAKKAIEALKEVPLDRLMLETDCPYMAPVPWRGQRCDSTMITSIAEKAASIKGITPQEMLDITCENAKKFFNII